MQTECPDCHSSIVLEAATTNPDATVTCGTCGSLVRPGAFVCRGCGAPLQVQRHLLPAHGGRGRCPGCDELIDIPSLEASARPDAATPPGIPELPVGGDSPETWAAASSVLDMPNPAATQRIDLADLPDLGPSAMGPPDLAGPEPSGADAGPADPRPEPGFPPMPIPGALKPAADATVVSSAAPPVPRRVPPPPPRKTKAPVPKLRPRVTARGSRPARRGRRGWAAVVGLLLGGAGAAGGGFAAIARGVWDPPASPVEFASDLTAGLAMLGIAGAVVGAVLGALLGGTRR